MSFPWAIKANTKTLRKRDLRLAAWRLRRRPSLSWFVFQALGSAALLALGLPVAAAPLEGMVKGSGAWTGANDPVKNLDTRTMTIEQTQQKAVLNWTRLNIETGERLHFEQQSSNWAALNLIHDQSQSVINGAITARGQVYLINQNGILFGGGAQIDTHTFVASTLNLPEQVFNAGLADAINKGNPAFAAAGAMGKIEIESGAVLKTAEGGKIMIFAPEIKNSGTLSTPGGQAILAASHDKVYLASDDENTRGFLVEVNTGGNVENLGKIIAERGNVSLVGFAVKQNGLVRATTAVNLNGSIRLVAQDQVTVHEVVDKNNIKVTQPQATRTGALTFGENSLTEVVADNPAQTTVDSQKQPLSRVDLVGGRITLEKNAAIVAPSGQVNITATKNPVMPGPSKIPDANNDSEFVMKSGSRIDVSGLRSAVVPIERNIVAVELRGTQLADSPLQHNGPLYKETVYIDTRRYGTNPDGSVWQGTPLANASGEIAKIERPLAERLATGGKVAIVSDNKVITAPGSTIDVSGGAIRYQDGYVNTTQLVSQGKIYDIADADPNRVYDGVFGTYKAVHKKWGVTESFNIFGSQGSSRFETGYVEGKDAGSVAINGRDLQDIQGRIRGETIAGRYQRLAQSSDAAGYQRHYDQVPLGGELVLGDAQLSGLNDFNLHLLTQRDAPGVNRMRVYANGKIQLPTESTLALAPGGELTLTTNGAVDVEGKIVAHGGTVKILASGVASAADETSVKLGETASVDVSGQWVNDSVTLNPGAAPQDPLFINGGKVEIVAAGDLNLTKGSLIDASGGAQLQRNGKLQYGKGGDITLIDAPSVSKSTTVEASDLFLNGELRAYSFNKGGNLTLKAAGFRIDDQIGGALAHTVYLAPEFFQRGGFNNYQLTATHTGISIAHNTDVWLRPMNRVLNPQFHLQASGADLNGVASLAVLPDYQQQAVSLGLTYARNTNVAAGIGQVELETGANIHANPGANISLASDTSLIVDGTIAAPAGNIQLSLLDNSRIESGTPPPKTIRLGAHGQLLAGAIYQPIPDSTGRGQRLGTVRNGGTVTIAANTKGQGYFIASPDSRIDVSGATQTLDVTQGVTVTPTTVNGAAGTIGISAAEGMVLNGELIGKPGAGAGAAGGTLNITLGSDANPNSTIALTNATTRAPALNETLASTLKGQAQISPDKIKAGGFDALALHSQGKTDDPNAVAQIRLEGDIDLKLNRSLELDAPILLSDGGQAKFSASYIKVGPTNGTKIPSVSSGTGKLLLQGQHIDLVGSLILRGFGPDGGNAGSSEAPVQIQSEGDIRLIGNDFQQNSDGSVSAIGRLNSPADITFRAKQIYTSTATDYRISVNGADGKISIHSAGASQAPLSAASKLTLTADNIEQLGTLRAPFGQIELNANKNLVLGDGSVTSVSGAGQWVPFGKTEIGQDWVYPLAPSYQGIYTAAPEKRIVLKAPDLTLAKGSVVDVAGGGDMLAREHQPGPGGTVDILDADHAKGAFAIVPANNNLFGSYDPFLNTSSIKPGDTLHVAGGGPLPAGEYAVLPAGYALLPGAYLVTPLSTASPAPGQSIQMFDGSRIVAAQRGVAGTAIRDSLWSAFRVENGAQIRNRAEYMESKVDNFVAAGASRFNRDAGRLVLEATTALNLGGKLTTNAGGGRGSEVDILANHLAVVNSYTGASDRVELLDSGLNNLNADSLLLGASRQHQNADMVLSVRATDVTVESGTALSAPEVMLAASDRVTIADNATITATNTGNVNAPASIQLAGNGALARVSSGDQVRVQRNAASDNSTALLNVAAGSVLDAARSITLDSSGDAMVDGALRALKGSISLGAARVSLGETQNVSGGLVLSNERLDQLTHLNARDLILNSRGTVDLYGRIAIDHLNRLAFNAAGIAGYRNANQTASFTADSISLSNLSGKTYAPLSPPNGSGNLNFSAREITLGATGDNGFTLQGFGNAAINATEKIIAQPETKTPVKLHVAGDVAMQTPLVTASSGTDVVIDTQNIAGQMAGKLTLNGVAGQSAATNLGAKLELAATQIELNTKIELPSGIVNLRATEAGGLKLGSNAVIDVSGRDVSFAEFKVGSPGGQIALNADKGDIHIGAQARIDVSGAPSGADAGKLSIAAPQGTVNIDPAATLAASAHGDGRAASFTLDARRLANNFSTLNAALNAAGFTDGRQFRLRQGDVDIDGAVLAHDLRIAADAGSIDVSGHIDASGSQAGSVELYARDDVNLQSSSRIDAYATGKGEKGGSVTLGSGLGADGNTPGHLKLQTGAKINVAGRDENAATETETGTVHLRAARQGNGVAVDPIAANIISGAERVNIEAYKIYPKSSINAADIAEMQNDNNAYMANASQIKNTLGVGSDTHFHLLPGPEIRSNGDLTLNTSWDLWDSQRAEPGILRLRAKGNLYLNNNLSDGVVSSPVVDGLEPRDIVQQGVGWSYRLVGGADLTGANPMAVQPDSKVGDVVIASGVKVRTGRGDIDIAAGRDLKLAADGTAAIYTVGENRGTGSIPEVDGNAPEVIQEIIYGGDFLQKGGDIRIAVEGNVDGANSGQFINEWMPRSGKSDIDTDVGLVNLGASWAIDVAAFRQNIGTLGGGNISISAKGEIEDLSVVIPTSGRPEGGFGTAPSITGGGDLRIQAGKNIRGGIFYLGKGRADIEASDSISQSKKTSLYPVLALSDGQYNLQARKDATIEAIVNPTVLPQSLDQGSPPAYPFKSGNHTVFFTYSSDSAAHVTSLAGDVLLRGNVDAIDAAFNLISDKDRDKLRYYPGTLSARSLQGDINIGGSGFTLLPAPQGNLELLARGSIVPASSQVNILLSDADPAQIPSPLQPALDITNALNGDNALIHAASPVHQNDTQAARIVAETGNVGSPQFSQNLQLVLAKSTRVYAGNDVRNLDLRIQNVNDQDISVIEAGGSIVFPTERNAAGVLVPNQKLFEVAGPGQFYVVAGKNVDLGASNGIQSIGNRDNKALSNSGASITVMAGQAQTPDYVKFIDEYLTKPAYSERLTQYMNDLAAHETDETKAKAFRENPFESFCTALPLVQQRKFILQVFFNELRESGIAAAKSSGRADYRRGYEAIKTLFPAESYPGNLKSFLSQIYTRDGGDINLVVPGGLINAGVASASGIVKQADQLGIVALNEGNINAYVKNDFLVNSSRVFALDGGGILMWTNLGNIDAGKGSKTALSVPSPQTSHDKDGNTFVEFPAFVSGSGIRTEVRTPGRKAGDVYLVAPGGVINAGDAGIGAAGNLTIAATAVLGADNIKVGGTAVGVPTDSGGLGAGLAGVGDIAATASKVAEDATRGLGAQANERQGFLGVEVIGFGE